mmetsp:Transcript_13606/g.41128  ORF Transcript_13606/g.41128 Transcript_13606/m.41128 type:complete len:269 (+) Transcript_13606:1604-2410(+)
MKGETVGALLGGCAPPPMDWVRRCHLGGSPSLAAPAPGGARRRSCSASMAAARMCSEGTLMLLCSGRCRGACVGGTPETVAGGCAPEPVEPAGTAAVCFGMGWVAVSAAVWGDVSPSAPPAKTLPCATGGRLAAAPDGLSPVRGLAPTPPMDVRYASGSAAAAAPRPPLPSEPRLPCIAPTDCSDDAGDSPAGAPKRPAGIGVAANDGGARPGAAARLRGGNGVILRGCSLVLALPASLSFCRCRLSLAPSLSPPSSSLNDTRRPLPS